MYYYKPLYDIKRADIQIQKYITIYNTPYSIA